MGNSREKILRKKTSKTSHRSSGVYFPEKPHYPVLTNVQYQLNMKSNFLILYSEDIFYCLFSQNKYCLLLHHRLAACEEKCNHVTGLLEVIYKSSTHTKLNLHTIKNWQRHFLLFVQYYFQVVQTSKNFITFGFITSTNHSPILIFSSIAIC